MRFFPVPTCRLGTQNEAKSEEIVDARKVFKKGHNIKKMEFGAKLGSNNEPKNESKTTYHAY